MLLKNYLLQIIHEITRIKKYARKNNKKNKNKHNKWRDFKTFEITNIFNLKQINPNIIHDTQLVTPSIQSEKSWQQTLDLYT